jgi:hypothetical protein
VSVSAVMAATVGLFEVEMKFLSGEGSDSVPPYRLRRVLRPSLASTGHDHDEAGTPSAIASG